MTDGNPYAEFATGGGGTTSGGENPYAEFAPSSSASEDEPKSAYGKAAEYAPGFFERGIGVDETLNDLGVGGYVPVFRNGKLSVGLPPNEELAKQEKILEDSNRGIKGTAKEIATDPVTYMPFKGSLIASGMKQGALSSALGPSTDSKQTLGRRARGTAAGGALGGATGGIMHALGGFKSGATGDIFDALKAEIGGLTPDLQGKTSKIYDQAKKMGLSFTGKESPQEVWTKIQDALKGKVSIIAEGIDAGAGAKDAVWPVGVNLATSKMYEATKQAGTTLYEKARTIGAKEEMPAEEVIGSLDKFISGMEKDAPLHAGIDPNFNSKLNKIRTLRDAIAQSDGKELSPWEQIQAAFNHAENNPPKMLNGAQLVELDQAVNSFYGSKGTGDKANIPVNNIKATFDKAIGSMSPEFQKSYSAAKNYWRQNVIQNFEENSVLGKFWKPEDYEAFKAMSKGIELHPDLKRRVEGFLDKIDSPLALDELKKSLPPDIFERVRGAKFVSMMDKAGINSKIIADDNNYKLLVKALANKPEDLQALDAIKTFTEEMNSRGIIREMTPSEREASNRLLDRVQRTLFSFATGHRLYGLRHTTEALTAESPNVAQSRLQGFAKEVAKGAPKKVRDPVEYTPGKVMKGALQPVAAEEGKQTQ